MCFHHVADVETRVVEQEAESLLHPACERSPCVAPLGATSPAFIALGD